MKKTTRSLSKLLKEICFRSTRVSKPLLKLLQRVRAAWCIGLWNMKSWTRVFQNQIRCFSLYLIWAKTLIRTLPRHRQKKAMLYHIIVCGNKRMRVLVWLFSPIILWIMNVILILCGLIEAIWCSNNCEALY